MNLNISHHLIDIENHLRVASGQGSCGVYVSKTPIFHWLRVTPTVMSSRIPAHLMAVQVYSWLVIPSRREWQVPALQHPQYIRAMCQGYMKGHQEHLNWTFKRHLSCFQVFAILNNFTKKIIVYVPLWICITSFLRYISKSEIVCCEIHVVLILLLPMSLPLIVKLLSKDAFQISASISSYESTLCPYPFQPLLLPTVFTFG